MDECDDYTKGLLLAELREAVRREAIRQLVEEKTVHRIIACSAEMAKTTKKFKSAVTHEHIGLLVKEETDRVLNGKSPVDAPNSSLPDLSESWARKSVIRWVRKGILWPGRVGCPSHPTFNLLFCVQDTPNKACGKKDCGWSILTRWNSS